MDYRFCFKCVGDFIIKVSVKKNVLIVGLGKSGFSATKYFHDQGYVVHGIDDDWTEDKRASFEAMGGEIVHSLQSHYEHAIVSPGVTPSHPFVQKLEELNVPIFDEIEVGLRECPGKKIAVTGTNGKTTTVHFLQHVLMQAGRDVYAVGNNEVPVTSQLGQHLTDESLLIVECSTFQIERFQGDIFHGGAVLNITEDHLDRHHTFEKYSQLKWKLKEHIQKEGFFFIDPSLTQQEMRNPLPKITHPFLQRLVNDLPVHDQKNFFISYAILRELDVDDLTISRALITFRKPSHRIEYICTIDGINYYNDSKGTNIAATIAAVNSIEGDITLIAGGAHKGSPEAFKQWIVPFQGRVKKILAIGSSSRMIQSMLTPFIDVIVCDTLSEAVQLARCETKKGGAVLLSSGCASFDMYKSYKERGNQFVEEVLSFKEEVS